MECMVEKKVKPCHLCAARTHNSNACPDRVCFNCAEPGHEARHCNQPHWTTHRCGVCGDTGHHDAICPHAEPRSVRVRALPTAASPRRSPPAAPAPARAPGAE